MKPSLPACLDTKQSILGAVENGRILALCASVIVDPGVCRWGLSLPVRNRFLFLHSPAQSKTTVHSYPCCIDTSWPWQAPCDELRHILGQQALGQQQGGALSPGDNYAADVAETLALVGPVAFVPRGHK